jgi:hypothetical protein
MTDIKPKTTKQTLLFVYNADSGILNSAKDYVQKIISPKTYECNLCAVTFGNFGMKNEWKRYVDSLNYSVEFLHRDEFQQKYSLKNEKFPAAFIKHGETITKFISNTEIDKCKTLNDLILLVKKKIPIK